MSRSVSASGTPDEVVAAIEKYGKTFTAPSLSKDEFEAARPHLIALVKENHVSDEGIKSGWSSIHPELSAYGSGSTRGDVELSRECSVSIKRFYPPPPPAAA